MRSAGGAWSAGAAGRSVLVKAVVCAICLCSAGCFTRPSVGEEGRAELAYDEGLFGCLFGCDADEPMAAHAHTFLTVVNDDELPAFSASSSDETVIEFHQDGGAGDASIQVESHSAGAADLELHDTSGALVDRFEMRVHEIDDIRLGSVDISSTYLIMIGGSDALTLELRDDRGRRLKGFGGVEYTVSGGVAAGGLMLTSALAEAIARAFAGSTVERATVGAVALGEGSIVVSARGGAGELTIPVEVVDASAVARVAVEDARGRSGDIVSLSARAFRSDGEEIHAPECEWSLDPAAGAVSITSQSRSSISVTAATTASATVTCTIGAASESGTVSFTPEEP